MGRKKDSNFIYNGKCCAATFQCMWKFWVWALRCWVIELFNNLRKIKRHPARCSKFQSSMVLGAWLDSNFNARCLLEVRKNGNQINSKNSFLRALMEVAPEMELFLENHAQYIKIFVMKLIYIQSCTFRHFTKKIVSWRICLKRRFATFFCGKSLPNSTLYYLV